TTTIPIVLIRTGMMDGHLELDVVSIPSPSSCLLGDSTTGRRLNNTSIHLGGACSGVAIAEASSIPHAWIVWTVRSAVNAQVCNRDGGASPVCARITIRSGAREQNRKIGCDAQSRSRPYRRLSATLALRAHGPRRRIPVRHATAHRCEFPGRVT